MRIYSTPLSLDGFPNATTLSSLSFKILILEKYHLLQNEKTVLPLKGIESS